MMQTSFDKSIADIIDLGISEYREAYNVQREILRKRLSGIIDDTVIITEHKPVFTISRLGSKENLLATSDEIKDKGIELIEIDRGGDITFHGPGQLVMYPIIDLKGYSRDIHEYIRRLEEVVIDFLLVYDIKGFRVPGASGVWVGKNLKIASVGISIKRWTTYHGISVNVNIPLHYFDMIVPCGLKRCKAVSIASLLKKPADIQAAKSRLTDSFKKVFRIWRDRPWSK
ncbi:MAG: lipoyl(octanoyl) transferase LipB [Candidatus Omnitrophota bacterium]